MAATHVLFEAAIGYAVFSVSFSEDIARRSKQLQEAMDDVSRFGSMVKLASFVPFKDAANALDNINENTEGALHEDLRALLELALPQNRKKVVLGVAERGLAGAIKTALGVECDASDRTLDLVRGIRTHAEKLIPDLQAGDLSRANLGMAHAYSRAKVKFNVNRSDNMIIQSIALVDQLDKDVNLFAMRVREWYGWHFPELVRIVPDNYQYARSVLVIGDKSKHMMGVDDAVLAQLTEALDGDESRAQNVFDAARSSMGTDISPIDLLNILNFASRVVHLFKYRASLQQYLAEKMSLVAPNLGALIGNTVAARLISHAGSLTNLSKYPASTVQILGAEKALFRALKTKGNTPKYGLIYHSTFIGRAGAKNKGRISRFLANKCSIASRIDCFADGPTTRFGEALRDQVEERLAFYETGSAPTRNAEAMAKVLAKLRGEAEAEGDVIADAADLEDESVAVALKGKSKSKKRKSEAAAADVPADGDAPLVKRKKSKASKLADTPATALSAAPLANIADDSMDVDASTADPAEDKAARKAAKKAAKAAAAQAAVAEELGSAAASAPVTTVGATIAASGATEPGKKKKRKSAAA